MISRCELQNCHNVALTMEIKLLSMREKLQEDSLSRKNHFFNLSWNLLSFQ